MGVAGASVVPTFSVRIVEVRVSLRAMTVGAFNLVMGIRTVAPFVMVTCGVWTLRSSVFVRGFGVRAIPAPVVLVGFAIRVRGRVG